VSEIIPPGFEIAGSKLTGRCVPVVSQFDPTLIAVGLPENMHVEMSDQCRNCHTNLTFGQAYCSACGQKRISGRLTLHEIARDLIHAVFHVDRSAISLVRVLLVSPGTVALDYVQGHRKRYFGPFGFLLIVVAAASAAFAVTGFRVVPTNDANMVADFLQSHINLVMFAEVPLLAGFSRLLYRRAGFNFAEHLVLAAYTSGLRMLFATVFLIPAWYLFRPTNTTGVYLYVGFLTVWSMYFGFAASQFFPGRRVLSWCKGILTALLAWTSIQVLVTLAASVIVSYVGKT
jgi:Protein of unknown function (DUF3667)